MRQIIAYDAKLNPDNSVELSRCYAGIIEEATANTWLEAVKFLVEPIADSEEVFTVCFNLIDFVKVLFSLLPDAEQELINKQDRIYYDNVKVFLVHGRYLGLTATIPIKGNICQRSEINLQALKWFTSEDAEEPSGIKETYELGQHIVKVLDDMKFYPTKLTSPVGVFTDCYLGDSRKYPTAFNFDEANFGAMEYATELMRFEWRSAYELGYFPETHLYDITSAYPSVIYNLPSTNDCRCEYSETRPEWATFGIMKGEVEITAEISPLVYELPDGNRINPKGKWQGYFTTTEIDFIEHWNIGHFKIQDGWFFRFGKERPYQEAIEWLYAHKLNPDKFVSTIGKRMANGLSGKLDEDRKDGKKGDFYNPVMAAMVRSTCRIRVAKFIYQNSLQDDVIAVLVDSVLSKRAVNIPEDGKTIGSWRYEGVLPALALSKGQIWRPGKRPMGIGYEQILEAMQSNPDSGYYELKTTSGSLRAIDLIVGNELDREFEEYPRCGSDLLAGKYRSTAIQV